MLKYHAASGEFSAIANSFIWVRLSVNDLSTRKWFQQYQIRGVPTTIVMTPQKKVICRFCGYFRKSQEYLQQIAQACLRYAEQYYRARKYRQAYTYYQLVAHFGKQVPATNNARYRLQEMRSNPQIAALLKKHANKPAKARSCQLSAADEAKAQQLYQRAQKAALAGDKLRAQTLLRLMLKAFPQARCAPQARKLLLRLLCPGYQADAPTEKPTGRVTKASRPRQASSTSSQEDEQERRAKMLFVMAKNFLLNHRPDLAKAKLQLLLSQYPDSQYAPQAQKMLERLK